MVLYLPKNADIRKIKRLLVLKGILFKTTYVCVLSFQTQVSSTILNFRHRKR